jgi:hypothetical protein
MSNSQEFEIDRQWWAAGKPGVSAVLAQLGSTFQWLAGHWKVVAINLFALPILGLIYWTINSIGVRLTFPVMAAKVYRVPGFGFLRHYYGWQDLDLANIMALGLLAFVWALTVLMMHIFLYGSFCREDVNEQFVNKFIPVAGLVLVIFDAVMFCNGIGEQSGILGNDGVSPMQIVLTIGYSTAMLTLAFFHAYLENHGDSGFWVDGITGLTGALPQPPGFCEA